MIIVKLCHRHKIITELKGFLSQHELAISSHQAGQQFIGRGGQEKTICLVPETQTGSNQKGFYVCSVIRISPNDITAPSEVLTKSSSLSSSTTFRRQWSGNSPYSPARNLPASGSGRRDSAHLRYPAGTAQPSQDASISSSTAFPHMYQSCRLAHVLHCLEISQSGLCLMCASKQDLQGCTSCQSKSIFI